MQIRALTYFDRPSIPIIHKLTLQRPSPIPGSTHTYSKPISCTLFYAHSMRELAWASEVVYDLPGGGFVSMGPEHHEERLRHWAIRTGRPVISLDYGKAPECKLSFSSY